MDYFERQLKVGALHDKINLPFKWYIGSYIEYQRLTSLHLREALTGGERIAGGGAGHLQGFQLRHASDWRRVSHEYVRDDGSKPCNYSL